MSRNALDSSAVDALLDALPGPAAASGSGPAPAAARPPRARSAEPQQQPAPTPRRKKAAAGPSSKRREKMSFDVPEDLAERARRVCYWVPGHITLTELVVNGLERLVAQYEKDHGGPFPERRGPIRTGRPFNSR